MEHIKITLYDLAQRFIGTKEVKGTVDNPQILAMLKLDDDWPKHDETPWCSAFVNYVAWLLRLPRSKSLLARSWTSVGKVVPINRAEIGFDVVVLWRGSRNGKFGHVGFYAGHDRYWVYMLGGNQGDEVNVSQYSKKKILSIRRLYG